MRINVRVYDRMRRPTASNGIGKCRRFEIEDVRDGVALFARRIAWLSAYPRGDSVSWNSTAVGKMIGSKTPAVHGFAKNVPGVVFKRKHRCDVRRCNRNLRRLGRIGMLWNV